jgi:hypothetical protein
LLTGLLKVGTFELTHWESLWPSALLGRNRSAKNVGHLPSFKEEN